MAGRSGIHVLAATTTDADAAAQPGA